MSTEGYMHYASILYKKGNPGTYARLFELRQTFPKTVSCSSPKCNLYICTCIWILFVLYFRRMCTNVYECVRMCTNVYVCVRMCTYVYVCVRMCTYVYVCVRMCTYVYVCVRLCTYVYVCVRMCTYVYVVRFCWK